MPRYQLDSNQEIQLNLSRPFTVAVSGTFADGGGVHIGYATSLPVRAAVSLTAVAQAGIRYEAWAGGPGGNDYSVKYENPGVSNSPLSIAFDGEALVVSLATSGGNAATLTTALTGTNNDLVFTSLYSSTGGNALSIRYADPGANNAELSVTSVNALDFVVRLATNGGGAIISTAAQVKAALEAYAPFAAKLTVANAASNNGSGVVTALAKTNLSGGGSGYTLTTTANQFLEYFDQQSNAFDAHFTANLIGGNDGTGILAATATIPLTGGSAGEFATYQSGETGSFFEAGEREFLPVGLTPAVRLSTTDFATSDAVVIITEQPVR